VDRKHGLSGWALLFVVILAAILLPLLNGCAAFKAVGIGREGGVLGTGVGDLKVNETEAAALNAVRPGLGDMLRPKPEAPKGELVPAGYTIRWRSYLGGVEINEADIVRRPELVAAPGVPAAVVTLTNAAPADPPLSSSNHADDVGTVIVTNAPRPRPPVPGID